MDQFEAVEEKRRHKRLELEVEVIVRTDRAMIPGRSQEISEGGMSAILPVELGDGEKVELQVKLPSTIATTHAIVRHRNVFRHGFEFLQPFAWDSWRQLGQLRGLRWLRFHYPCPGWGNRSRLRVYKVH